MAAARLLDPPEVQASFLELTTADGLALPALCWGAPGSAGATGLVLVHGAAGSLVSAPLRHLAERLARRGLPSLTFSNRGHDIVWEQGGRTFGHAYEDLDEYWLDLDAAIDAMLALGCSTVVLVGHSLGAIKVLAYAVEHVRAELGPVIAISPPRLSARHFATVLGEAYEQCVAWVDEHGSDDLPVHVPPPFRRTLLTRRAFRQRYASERWDVLPLLGQLRCSTTVVFGGEERGPSYDGLAALVRDALPANGGHVCEVIPGADHSYAGFETSLTELVEQAVLKPGLQAY